MKLNLVQFFDSECTWVVDFIIEVMIGSITKQSDDSQNKRVRRDRGEANGKKRMHGSNSLHNGKKELGR